MTLIKYISTIKAQDLFLLFVDGYCLHLIQNHKEKPSLR